MASKPKPAQPINRNGYWYLVRRVPQRPAQPDGRGSVVWSTGIPVRDDPCCGRWLSDEYLRLQKATDGHRGAGSSTETRDRPRIAGHAAAAPLEKTSICRREGKPNSAGDSIRNSTRPSGKASA